MTPQIILASSSKQRQNLLRAAGVAFTVVAADLDEKALAQGVPNSARAVTLARAKAAKIAEQHPNSIIIAADTFSIFNDEVLEKPVDLDDARRMLRLISGQTVSDHTGVCCWNLVTGKKLEQTVITQFTFRRLSDTEIDRYITTQPVTTWSAAFSAAYDVGMALVAHSEGSLTALTHGLPIELVMEFLTEQNT